MKFARLRPALALFAGLWSLGAHSADLVINEIEYDQPGTDTAEWFEIKNTTGAAIDLSLYRVRLINGAGAPAAYDTIAFPAGTMLAAGGYYVVCGGTVPGCNLDDAPNQDFMQNGAPDAIVLELAAAPNTVMDVVSYEGTTTGFTEGTGVATSKADGVNAGEGLARCADGADTDNNDADFSIRPNTLGAANNCTPDAAPSVSSTTPANAAMDVAIASDVTITFSENVVAPAAAYSITCATSGAHPFVLTGTSPTFTLNPSTDFANGETCTVTVLAAQVTDQDGVDPPNNMSADHVFSFTTVSADAAPTVSSTVPADNAIDIAIDANVGLTFSEAVTVTGSWFTINCATSGAHTATAAGGPTTFSLDPDTNFANNELCTVTVLSAGVADQDGVVQNMAADYVFDFTTIAAGDQAPTVTSTTPTDNATNVPRDANIVVNFSEPVTPTGAWFTIQCTMSGAHTATVSGGPTAFTLNPDTDFVYGDDCDVSILSAQVSDVDGTDPPDTMASDYLFGFATSAPFTAISQIQGSGRNAALLGTQTTEGIVTARVSNGFFIQSAPADADGNINTSEGIFVFGTPVPAVATIGARVRVTGTVIDFRPSADPFQLPITEFSGGVTVSLVDAGPLPLPAPIDLSLFAPTAAGGLDQLERFEGMRVTVPTFVVTAPSGSAEYNGGGSNGTFFGVVQGTARPFREPGVDVHQPLPAGTTATAVPFWDANPELIRVRSSGQTGSTQIDVPAGTTITGLTGVMDYAFRRYTILPDVTQSPAPTIGTLPTGQAVSVPGPNDITIGSYNIACGTGGTCPTNRGKVSLGVNNFLRTPDILGVVEVTSQAVLDEFVTRINNDAVAAAAPNPMYVGHVESTSTQALGVMWKTAEIAPGVPRVSVNINDIIHVGTTEVLRCPDGTPTGDILNDRPPLIVPATINSIGKPSFPVTVIVNHPKSLIGIDDETTYPPADPFACFGTVGARNREKRLQQSEFLASFLHARQQSNPAERVVLVGDFNAFQFNDGYVDVIGTTTGNPTPDNQTVQPADGDDLLEPSYFDIVGTAPPPGPYSYVFGGNAQVLDHVIVNDAVIAGTTDVQVEFAHINADYRRQADASNTATALRASDHDPVLAFLTQALPPTISDIGNQTGTEDTSIDDIPFTIADPDGTVTCANVTGSASQEVPVPDPNIQITNGPGPGQCRLRLVPFPNATGTSTITLTVTDSDGLTASDSFTVTINEGNNDPPSVVAPNDATIGEDTVFGPVSVPVGDIDSDSATLALTGASSNDAVVPDGSVVVTAGASGSSRNLTITPAPNAFGTTTITLTVTDTGGASSTDTFELTITPSNDAPTISAIADATIAEDGTFGPTAFTIGDAETAVTCASVTAASSNTTLVPLAAIAIGGAAQNCTVTVTPAANASGSATITLSLSDGTTSVDEPFTLTVTAANDSPTISDVPAQFTNEDTATGAIAFTVGDVETAAASLVVAGTSSNTSIVANGGIVIGGSGANRTVTITPVPNANGTVTITLTVTDADGGTATDTFVLTVASVNDGPSITAIADRTIPEDGTTGPIAFTISDIDHPLDCDDVAFSSSNDLVVPESNIVIGGGTGQSCTITATPVANAVGQTVIEVSIADGAGGFAAEAFTLTVDSGAAGNDAPTITGPSNQTILQNGSTAALPVTVGDIETPAANLVLTATSSDTTLVPNGNIELGGSGANRTVRVTPAAGRAGTTTITLTVADADGGSAQATFTVTVTATGDPIFGNGFE